MTAVKRTFDFTAASLLLLFLVPLMIVLALLVRWKLGAPVLFRQERPGLYEKPFYFLKFRTMTGETDRAGNLLPDEQRLTPFGMFLRRYSLDELPQLFNVLKGDLSLVGPRPLLMEYLDLYTDEQRVRHEVKPGITGWAQVNGRNGISWEKKFEYDYWYVKNHSFLIDLKILFMTVYKVFRSEGISQTGHVTVKRFEGAGAKVRGGPS
ncbi:sugar transferase [Alteribacter lacisalsi]|uniref:Sugar transferase n=1 Tax=Alteribacter lacisalsi TaxID=2045244 RepID=A0A2W0HA86_9BACI|nr:sugar transferase [Alteribacter lacisalsi]PYZ96950.1 sugar transferase [Alteribacter lacisalsi]